MKEKEFTKLYGKAALFKPTTVKEMFECSLSHVYALIDDEILAVNRDADGFKTMPIRIKRASILAYLKGESV